MPSSPVGKEGSDPEEKNVGEKVGPVTLHLGRPLGSSGWEVMSDQPPSHQVRQEVTEGSSCGRAEADGQQGHGEREQKARDYGEKYGAGYGESLEEDVNTEEPSKYLQGGNICL